MYNPLANTVAGQHRSLTGFPFKLDEKAPVYLAYLVFTLTIYQFFGKFTIYFLEYVFSA